jgi:4-diphosphocytidyl-2-C-methyl-D-erythritol kinase
VGRRSDGYHELESVFLPLDWADRVEIDARPAAGPEVSIALVGAAPGVPAGPGNLAARAARAFLDAAGLARAVRIRLFKRIPAAAGLGGGSSDAGAVLRGLSALCGGALDAGSLRRIAAELGADVPFFLEPAPAFVSGIGERCERLEPAWPPVWLVLANPGTALPTAHVFEAWDALTLRPRPPTLRPLVDRAGARPADPAVLRELLENDLEPAAVRLCPAIARLREALRRAGALGVALSGSGATVFGVFGGMEAASRAAGRVAAELPPGGWARVARTRESG